MTPLQPACTSVAGPEPDRCVRVVRAMGTVISVDVRAPESSDTRSALDEAESVLRHADDGEACSRGLPSTFAELLELSAEVERLTDGWFMAGRRGDGTPASAGLVTGWTIGRASRLLTARGFADHCLSTGRAVAVAGRAAGQRGWRIGVADPRRAVDLLGMVAAPVADAFAVATATVSESGRGVADPPPGQPTDVVLAAMVAGPVLCLADGLATALVAAGEAAPSLLERWRTAGWSGALLTGTGELVDPDRLVRPLSTSGPERHPPTEGAMSVLVGREAPPSARSWTRPSGA